MSVYLNFIEYNIYLMATFNRNGKKDLILQKH